MFYLFWCFRDLPKLNLIWDFLVTNILSREPSRAQEANEGGHEAQKSTGGLGPCPGRATLARLSLRPPMPYIFVPDCSA
jgi:hypothetical protein